MTDLRFPRPRHVLAAVAVALVAGTSLAAGLDIHADADGKDVGLPIYPGAVKRAESGSGDSGAFSFGVWGDSFGFKLAVVSYRTTDGVRRGRQLLPRRARQVWPRPRLHRRAQAREG